MHEDMPHANEYFTLAYDELYRLARGYFLGERPGHTLQPTALVAEAYLRLQREAGRRFEDRKHFVAIAARAMRQVLIDHARRKNALKRDATTVLLGPGTLAPRQSSVDLFDLSAALERLNEQDPLNGSIVDLHFFAGLTVRETADVLDLAERSVYRKLRSSKAWLKATLLPATDAAAGP